MLDSILLIGLGALGSAILRELVRVRGLTIYAADVEEERGREIVELITSGAINLGYKPEVKFLRMDLTDIDGTADILGELEPRVICNTTALVSWWYPHVLPNQLAVRVARLGPGPWTPGHLALTYRLMRAVRSSGIKTRVLNASYNDAVSPALAKVGLAPHLGAGNLDLLVPMIRSEFARRLDVPIEEISIYLIAHHSLITDPERSPYILKAFCRGKDVTGVIPEEELRSILPRHYRIKKRWSGPPEQFHISSSFLKNLLAIYHDEDTFTHSPGPLGLPGGYPVKASYRKVELALPEGVSREEAIEVNERASRYDGIERIKDDGTIVLTEEAQEVMKEVFGIEHREYPIERSLELALELRKAYFEVLRKHKITPPYG